MLKEGPTRTRITKSSPALGQRAGVAGGHTQECPRSRGAAPGLQPKGPGASRAGPPQTDRVLLGPQRPPEDPATGWVPGWLTTFIISALPVRPCVGVPVPPPVLLPAWAHSRHPVSPAPAVGLGLGKGRPGLEGSHDSSAAAQCPFQLQYRRLGPRGAGMGDPSARCRLGLSMWHRGGCGCSWCPRSVGASG